MLKPKHPKIVQMNEKIDKARTILQIHRKQSEEQNAHRIKSIEIEVANLEAEIGGWETKALDTRERLNQYQQLLGQVDRFQGFYEKLLLSMHDVDQNRNLLIPRDAVKPLAAGGIIGALVAIALLLAMDRFDDRVRSTNEFTANFSEEVIGVIPAMPDKGRLEPLQQHDDRHMFSEAYRNLRSSFLFKEWNENRTPRTILITSAVPVEGKTTVASNLSITMALAGSRVLLIDADLRRGSLAKIFGVHSTPGLGDVISGRLSLDECVCQTHIPGLYLLPRGRELPAQSENVLTSHTRDCLDRAREGYDFVIIDSAPILVADDTTSLAPMADTTLYVMRLNATPGRLAERALAQLYSRQVKVGGVILNCESSSIDDYRTYGYYKYYTRQAKSRLPPPAWKMSADPTETAGNGGRKSASETGARPACARPRGHAVTHWGVQNVGEQSRNFQEAEATSQNLNPQFPNKSQEREIYKCQAPTTTARPANTGQNRLGIAISKFEVYLEIGEWDSSGGLSLAALGRDCLALPWILRESSAPISNCFEHASPHPNPEKNQSTKSHFAQPPWKHAESELFSTASPVEWGRTSICNARSWPSSNRAASAWTMVFVSCRTPSSPGETRTNSGPSRSGSAPKQPACRSSLRPTFRARSTAGLAITRCFSMPPERCNGRASSKWRSPRERPFTAKSPPPSKPGKHFASRNSPKARD